MAAFASYLAIPFHNKLCPTQRRTHRAEALRISRTRASANEIDFSPIRHEKEKSAFSFLAESFADAINPPPAPVVLARRTLDQDFAVTLMRAGYNAVDELDFVAMDEFQARFFHIRSGEWEKFIEKNQGIRQGVITDPRYFDFISYAQMLTIQYFMREPRAIFEEKYGDENGNWGTRVVRRDVEGMPLPSDIFAAWRRKVGWRVYQRLLDTTRRPQPVLSLDKQGVLDGIAAIYDYFRLCGFCLETRMDADTPGGHTLKVEVVAPCILWGSKELKRRKSVPNDYDCYAVEAFCEASGAQTTVVTVFSENSIIRTWSVEGAV